MDLASAPECLAVRVARVAPPTIGTATSSRCAAFVTGLTGEAPRHSLQCTFTWATKATVAKRASSSAGRHGRLIASANASSTEDSSYLSMWQAAQERKRKEQQQQNQLQSMAWEGDANAGDDDGVSGQEKSRRESAFFQMLEVPEEERRRVEKQQVMDRAAAALAAAQSLISEMESKQRFQRQVDRGRATAKDSSTPKYQKSSLSFTRRKQAAGSSPADQNGAGSYAGGGSPGSGSGSSGNVGVSYGNGSSSAGRTGSPYGGNSSAGGTPAYAAAQGALGGSSGYSGGGGGGGGGGGVLASGSKGPDFWSWVPPKASSAPSGPATVPAELKLAKETARARSSTAVLERAPQTAETLNLPFQGQGEVTGMHSSAAAADLESLFQASFSLPPLQSRVQSLEFLDVVEEPALDESLLADVHTAPQEQKSDVHIAADGATEGVMPDGSRWWRTTGRDVGAAGEVCEWTVVRGVSADGSVEWEEKWWESWDVFDYKEMGAEKSGRDANGGVWRECWQEAMWQDKHNGLPHIEKSADKWGQDGKGGEWQEKWWEHYDGLGRAEKWADKWSKIDASTPLDEGHAHVWHERWGEQFDGKGAASKYCDKWAERCVDVESNTWTKWGDKWDEDFNRDAHGYKRGETWWQGPWGEAWNRCWSEGHNGSGWVHKEGKSSSGEFWDVHEPMDTWYERKPHYGFAECSRQSYRLQQVGKKKKTL